MRFAIVDDIPAMQQELKEIIYDYCRSTDTIADICCFDSGEAFIAAFVPYSYDIVFMDIYMSGMNGTDTASLMRRSDNRVILIFLTSSPDHMKDAFNVHAFHYIEKPISRERMYCCLDDVFRLIPHNEAYINFTSDNVTVRLDYKDIIFIKADRHYTIICDCCNNIYQPYIYFTALTKPLMSDERFLQLSRGILCNMDYITGFSKDCCNLSNNTFLPITICNAKKLEQAWRNYTFDKLHRLVDR